MAVPETSAGTAPKLGIIAGGGDLPVKLVQACRRQGRPCFVVGLSGSATERPQDGIADAWASIGSAGKILGLLRESGCVEVVMAGNVTRPDFTRLRLDWKGIKVIARIVAAARKGDDHLLRSLVVIFEEEGFRVVGADQIFDDLLMPVGPLGQLGLPKAAEGDLARAIAIVEALGAVDVGQGAVVVDGDAVAVEAAEGTDRMLARAAELRAGWTRRAGLLVKLPKPGQEKRVDLPTIGVATVDGAAAAGLAGIAVAAGATLVIDRGAVTARADALGLFVVGIKR